MRKKYNFDIGKNETSVVNVPIGVKNKDMLTLVEGAARAYKSYTGLRNRMYNIEASGRKVYITRVA